MANEKKEILNIKKSTKEKLLNYISQQKPNMKKGEAFGGVAEVQDIDNFNSLDGVRTKPIGKNPGMSTSLVYYTVAKDKAEIFKTIYDDPNIEDMDASVVSENFLF